MGFVNYIPRGVGKVVVLMLKFPFRAEESNACRQKGNITLTQNFKVWLARSLGVADSCLGHQAGDINSVEFFWDSKLDATKVNRILNTAPFHPDAAEVTIHFQDQSAIAV